ncbi:MAG: DNA polymerase III subunit delta' [Rhodocyclaceae bacterium]|nr:DNA polymerase III subunit delta' [Rhodocyclaceae bacterium]
MQKSDNKHFNWHEAAWEGLWRASAAIPHAMLLAGPSGIGKGAFAREAVARLLCEHPGPAAACGACPSCHWLAGSNHPDFRHLRPESEVETDGDAPTVEIKKASRQIRIEQIRELEEFVFVGSHRGGARVVLIDPADTMNHAAQNALLKILEEPSLNVYFILVTKKIMVLLPTILSRCRVLKLPKPTSRQASDWLAINGDGQAAELLTILGGRPCGPWPKVSRGEAPRFRRCSPALPSRVAMH